MTQFTFEDMFQMIWDNPISGAQTAKSQHQSYRQRKYEFAGLGYALAAKLTVAPLWQEDFYKLPFFVGGYKPNAQNLLLHCMQYIYEDRVGSDSDRAFAHASALAPLFEARIDTREVLRMLKSSGGFRGLTELCGSPPTQEPRQLRRLENPDDSIASEPQAEEDDGSTSNGVLRLPGPKSGKSARVTKPKKSKMTKIKEVLDRYLLIAMEPHASMHSLFSLPVGEFRYIQISRVQDKPDGLVEFEGKLTSDVPAIKPPRSL